MHEIRPSPEAQTSFASQISSPPLREPIEKYYTLVIGTGRGNNMSTHRYRNKDHGHQISTLPDDGIQCASALEN